MRPPHPPKQGGILGRVRDAEQRGIKHIFVDNITFLLNDSEKGESAGAFMKKILYLKRLYGLTLVIVGLHVEGIVDYLEHLRF